jgi:hypothetical protein
MRSLPIDRHSCTGRMLLIILLGIVISYPAAVTALSYREC